MPTRSTRNSIPLPWLVVALGLVASLFLLSQGLQPCDDAYITFRHAKNLALEGRPAWNLAGDPVLGSTSPAFLFVLGALGHAFGVEHIPSIAFVINALALFATVVLGYAVARDLFAGKLAALLAAALVGFNSVNVLVFSLGFESGPFTALLLGSLLAVRRRRDLLAVILASLAPLVRPEGLLITPLVWGFLVVSGRVRAKLVAAFLLLPVLWAVFATGYYGSPVPQSVGAKRWTSSVYRPYDSAGLDLVGRLAELPAHAASLWVEVDGLLFASTLKLKQTSLAHRTTFWVSLAGLAALIATLARRGWDRAVHLLYPPAFLIFFAWLGQTQVWYFPAFVTSAVLILFTGCSHAVALASRRLWPSGRSVEVIATIAVFGLFLLANRYVLNRGERSDPEKGPVYAADPRGRSWQGWERERFDGYGRAARFLNSRSARPGPALISEVGFFGYYYDGPVIDAVGLCSPEALAFYPPPDTDIYDARGRYRTTANTITPSALVSALKPEYVVSSAIYIPHLLTPDAPFRTEYTLVTRSGEAWEKPILVFARNGAGEGGPRADAHRLPAAPAWFAPADASPFSGHPGARQHVPYDVVATDMDRDGDPDLLINWHHLEPLELFENRGGRFERSNPPERDASGLFESRGIPYLYAEASEITRRIRQAGAPGLYLWHDPDRQGSWRFAWHDEDRRLGALRVDLETNRDVVEVEGLAAGEVEQPSPRRLRIALEPGASPRRFAVRVENAATQLELRPRAGPRGEPPPLFVGSRLTRVPADALDVWMPDPHGMAWVDSEGTPHPELFLTRGAIMGTLRPPLDPKVERYYVHGGGGEPLYRMAAEGTIPPDYGRGRRVEWVDVDLDGELDLSITGVESPNRLLVRESPAGPFRDAAAERGLDLESEVGVWGDLEGDGFPDFFHLQGTSIDVARNRGGKRFELVAGETLGLRLPVARQESPDRHTALRWADFDNDGDLDLWVLAYGVRGSNHLFLRDGAKFRDVSHEVGLESVRGRPVFVLGDFDNDSFVDVASFGRNVVRLPGAPEVFRPRALLWRNRGGQRFEFGELADRGMPPDIRAATSLDADGDGRSDLVIVAAAGRYLLRNATSENQFLDVELRDGEREPIGAVVRAHYTDGTAAAQRYGSAHNTAFSQALQPLRFGIPSGARIAELAVRWPGEREDALFPVRGANTTAVIERRR